MKKWTKGLIIGIGFLVILFGFGRITFHLEREKAEDTVIEFVTNYPNKQKLKAEGIEFNATTKVLEETISLDRIELIDETFGSWTFRIISKDGKSHIIDLAPTKDKKWIIYAFDYEKT